MKAQFQYDEALIQAEKKKQEKLAEANNAKKKDAKPATNPPGGKKNIGSTTEAVQVSEEKKEVFQYEEEMKNALKIEKSKYRFRVTLLKYWGIHCLINIRKLANSIYNKLDDWIILSIKAENDALNALVNLLKNAIEKEQKIKYELELDTFDVIINMDVQNYIELPVK